MSEKEQKLETAKEMWQDYAAHIYKGIEVSEAQYVETQKAFYAGMFSMLETTFKISKVSDEKGVEALENLYVEVQKFIISQLSKS